MNGYNQNVMFIAGIILDGWWADKSLTSPNTEKERV